MFRPSFTRLCTLTRTRPAPLTFPRIPASLSSIEVKSKDKRQSNSISNDLCSIMISARLLAPATQQQMASMVITNLFTQRLPSCHRWNQTSTIQRTDWWYPLVESHKLSVIQVFQINLSYSRPSRLAIKDPVKRRMQQNRTRRVLVALSGASRPASCKCQM